MSNGCRVRLLLAPPLPRPHRAQLSDRNELKQPTAAYAVLEPLARGKLLRCQIVLEAQNRQASHHFAETSFVGVALCFVGRVGPAIKFLVASLGVSPGTEG